MDAHRFLLAVTLSLACGCSRGGMSSQDQSSPSPQQAQDAEPPRPDTANEVAAPAVAPPNPQLAEFRNRVREYVSEARSAIKLTDLGPSISQLTKKSETLTEFYSRIPDVPPEIGDPELPVKLKRINGSFVFVREMTLLNREMRSLKGDTSKTEAGIAKGIAELKSLCDEVLAAVEAPK